MTSPTEKQKRALLLAILAMNYGDSVLITKLR